MPVLTNFLPAVSLGEVEVAKQKDFVEQLNAFRTAVNLMQQTFHIRITKNSELGTKILKKEEAVYRVFWRDIGFIPADFEKSCLDIRMPYNSLSDLSKYPVTKISNLRKIANSLGFVILPIEYVNMEEIIKMYRRQNADYAKIIRRAFIEFKKTLDDCKDYTRKQQIYILAPVSFYDPWKEISVESVLPKYFSPKLKDLSTILGMVLPTQRNLYKMIKNSENNIENLNETMQQNFQMVAESIHECHKRLEWVEILTKQLSRRVDYLEGSVQSLKSQTANTAIELQTLQLQVTKLEHMLYCLLDPIIFSVNAGIDISSIECDDKDARIGLCFGTDMPIDFFIERGMTIVDDKRFEPVTYALTL